MARQVNLVIQPKGSSAPLSEYSYVKISQDLHTHHSFEIKLPFDSIEGREAGFMQKAHRELVGKTITFSLAPDANGEGGKLAFTGFVTDLTVASDNDYTGSFLIRGYSPTCLLTDGVQKRTFVDKSLSSIISQVLQPYPDNLVSTTKNLKNQSALPYVVQYNESNFDFLNRLMAECHEWFFYDGTQLHFGLPGKQDTVQLEMNRSWSSFQMEAAIRPGKIGLHSYDPTQNQHWKGNSSLAASGIDSNPLAVFAMRTANEVFSQPSYAAAPLPVQSHADVEQAAAATAAAKAASSLLFRGRSENPDLHLGTIIDTTAQGLGSDNVNVDSLGKYRIVKIDHEVDQAGNYTNSFTAVLHSLELPPINPSVRTQPGVPELAEVIDLADPEKIGRMRIRYYWPVQNPMDAESTWLRVLTPYSGDGKGQLFTPEVGSQVLVNYEHQRAEQAVVLGNLFHTGNKQGASYTQGEDANAVKSIRSKAGNKITMLEGALGRIGESGVHEIGKTLNPQLQGILGPSINISNANQKTTAVDISFSKQGHIIIKTLGPISVLSPDITLEAGDQGEIKMHGKRISMYAREEIKLLAKELVEIVSDPKPFGVEEPDEEEKRTGRKKKRVGGKIQMLSTNMEAYAGTSMRIIGDDDMKVMSRGEVDIKGKKVSSNGRSAIPLSKLVADEHEPKPSINAAQIYGGVDRLSPDALKSANQLSAAAGAPHGTFNPSTAAMSGVAGTAAGALGGAAANAVGAAAPNAVGGIAAATGVAGAVTGTASAVAGVVGKLTTEAFRSATGALGVAAADVIKNVVLGRSGVIKGAVNIIGGQLINGAFRGTQELLKGPATAVYNAITGGDDTAPAAQPNGATQPGIAAQPTTVRPSTSERNPAESGSVQTTPTQPNNAQPNRARSNNSQPNANRRPASNPAPASLDRPAVDQALRVGAEPSPRSPETHTPAPANT